MTRAAVRLLTFASMLALGLSAHGQTVGTRVPEGSGGSGADQPGPTSTVGTRVPEGSGESGAEQPAPDASAPPEEEAKAKPPQSLLDRFRATLSQEEDPAGPINTDRPTFTPANTVVPPGRLQFESGWTFNGEKTSSSRTYVYDFPELAVRYGLMDRVELRLFWLGQDDSQTLSRSRRLRRSVNGTNDMEVGFKWQLFPGDEKRKWIPTTALITSIIAPTGGSSPYSSETVEPYINLIYGWSLTKKLTLSGCTGYLGIREQGIANSIPRSDNFQRYHQSLVAFYSATERTTLFYEWYVLTFTNAPSNLLTHFMDGGILYRLTTNMQVDIRAGFGLSGRPDDFFTGTGFSVRF